MMNKLKENKKNLLIIICIVIILLSLKFINEIQFFIFGCYQNLNRKIGLFPSKMIAICIVSLFCILLCGIIGKYIDVGSVDNRSFSEKHDKLNLIIGLALVIILVALGCLLLFLIINLIKIMIDWLTGIASKMDAVVIVALITGSVSIIGVIISSIVAKIIDYKKSRQEYLAKKREESYGQFVDMVYRIQSSSKSGKIYTEEEMIEDISKFSKQITLWGSSKVVNKWVEFRENGSNPNLGTDNLFLLEEIMNEMRKDLGLKKVKKGNLLAFYINDIKKYLKK